MFAQLHENFIADHRVLKTLDKDVLGQSCGEGGGHVTTVLQEGTVNTHGSTVLLLSKLEQRFRDGLLARPKFELCSNGALVLGQRASVVFVGTDLVELFEFVYSVILALLNEFLVLFARDLGEALHRKLLQVILRGFLEALQVGLAFLGELLLVDFSILLLDCSDPVLDLASSGSVDCKALCRLHSGNECSHHLFALFALGGLCLLGERFKILLDLDLLFKTHYEFIGLYNLGVLGGHTLGLCCRKRGGKTVDFRSGNTVASLGLMDCSAHFRGNCGEHVVGDFKFLSESHGLFHEFVLLKSDLKHFHFKLVKSS
mmetsp:Transcript_13168/g.23375  ORF Transcript_13168/g.23375 Transcript_13168/m.23375 type:complete len:315 (-) Transcript_13168:3262-4206(-)